MIDKDVALTFLYIDYYAKYRRGKRSPSLLALLLFGIIWNSEDQNNESDKPEQKTYDTIYSGCKSFPPATKPWKCIEF